MRKLFCFGCDRTAEDVIKINTVKKDEDHYDLVSVSFSLSITCVCLSGFFFRIVFCLFVCISVASAAEFWKTAKYHNQTAKKKTLSFDVLSLRKHKPIFV